MGLLVEGEWKDKWYDTKSTDGHFKREDAQRRAWIKADGSTEFAPESGRYHLYVSLACPWAHRTLIFRKIKKLEEHISISVVDPLMVERGWEFSEGPGCIPDSLYQSRYMHEIYTRYKADYTGRVTVPVLWDKKTDTMVNNESSELIRMLNGEFEALTEIDIDFYPPHLRDAIDEINEDVYHNVNNGVYKCGFATSQEAYEAAFAPLFATLDSIEARLATQPYLCGDHITEADWRLFTTLVRFDPVYVGHFKCNLRRIHDYEEISDYLRALYQYPDVAGTCNMAHIKEHYYRSHDTINPSRIVPKGPRLLLDGPHSRPDPEDSVWRHGQTPA